MESFFNNFANSLAIVVLPEPERPVNQSVG